MQTKASSMREHGLVFSALLLTFVFFSPPTIGQAHAAKGAKDQKKVTICHVPPGNPANAHTISVGESAVSAHLAHGDYTGACSTSCQVNPSLCDDGNACTSDSCGANGQCAHDAVSCDDGNACTVDQCDPATGCSAAANDGAACDDGNGCTSGDECSGATCEGAPIAGCCLTSGDCSDDNPCTVDACGSGSCTNEPKDCAVADLCVAGFCDADGECGTTPVSCDDSNLCTDDACDPALGCTHVPTTAPPEATEVSCADGLDNDCDGAADGADPDCVCDDFLSAPQILNTGDATSTFTKDGGQTYTEGNVLTLADTSIGDFGLEDQARRLLDEVAARDFVDIPRDMA